MADVIATDNLLTEVQRRTLEALMDIVIPAHEARRMPSAKTIDLMSYVNEFANTSIKKIESELDSLNESSLKESKIDFADLKVEDQQALTEKLKSIQHGFVQITVYQTLQCYYQDDTVLTALGMAPGAPFPNGNDVPQGDLKLLDPVRARGKIYRE